MFQRALVAGVLVALAAACGGAALPVQEDTTGATTPAIWQPTPGLSWQIQYSGKQVAGKAKVIDVDGHGTSAAKVAKLKAADKGVICYFNAGAWENWRPDASAFPKTVIGKKLAGWPGERWLDIRAVDVRLPLMTARIQECADKGFDAECLSYHECSAYAPVLAAGKAVFHVEYRGTMKKICARTPKGVGTVRKHLSVSAWRKAC